MLLFIFHKELWGGEEGLKLGKCKVVNVAQKKKMGGNVRHCLHQALKITRRRYKRAGGENLLLDPWYVLVHGMGPYKVGQPYTGRG